MTGFPQDRTSSEAIVPIAWTPDAEGYLQEVPGRFRRKARAAIEDFARQHGYPEITPEVMKAARLALLGF